MSNQNNIKMTLELDKKYKKAAKAYYEWEQYLPYIMERLPKAIIAVENGRIAFDPTYQRVFFKGMRLEITSANPRGFMVTAFDLQNQFPYRFGNCLERPLGFIPVEALQDPEYYSHIAIEYEKYERGQPNDYERFMGEY
ncbi:MAG: hypothetical protein IJI63_04105 [Clostridiales bacterium]|nr:hypothetical protein [Clostridiales bacterium]